MNKGMDEASMCGTTWCAESTENGDAHIRIKDGSYDIVGLDKAFVLPLEQLAQVKDQLADVQNRGFSEAGVYQLILTETPL
jgi:hypothetical protein